MTLPGPFTRTGIAMVMVPLHAGPVLAGWGHLPPRNVFALAGIFALYVTFTRAPALRPSLLVLVVVQLVICGVLYAIGLALAAQGRPLALPFWLPVAVTGGAALLGAYRYRHMAQIDTFLDDALAAVETGRRAPDPAARDSAGALSNKVRRALWQAQPLPDQVDRLMAPLLVRHGPDVLGLLLADLGEGSDAFDLATIRHAGHDGIRRDAHLGLALELTLNSPNAAVRATALALAHRLIDEGAPPEALPDADWLTQADRSDPNLSRLAARLAAFLPKVGPSDGG